MQFIKTFGQCLASVASNVTKSTLLLPPLPSTITPQVLASAAAKARAANQSFVSTVTYVNQTVNQLVSLPTNYRSCCSSVCPDLPASMPHGKAHDAALLRPTCMHSA